MFGIGSTELLVILVVALIVLGPKSLAKVSRTLGKAMGEFRRVSTDFQRTLNAEAAEDERRERREAEAKAAQKAKEKAQTTVEEGGNDTVQASAEAQTSVCEGTGPLPSSQAEEMIGQGDSEHLVMPPSGSPLEAALAKTHAAAEAASGGVISETSSTSDTAAKHE